MTEHEPLKIIVLCRSWRDIDCMMNNLALNQQFIAVSFSKKRIVTKNKDDILFYTKDSKTMDGIHGDVLVTDLDITNLEKQIVRYSRVGTDKNIWSYADLIDYLGASR